MSFLAWIQLTTSWRRWLVTSAQHKYNHIIIISGEILCTTGLRLAGLPCHPLSASLSNLRYPTPVFPPAGAFLDPFDFRHCTILTPAVTEKALCLSLTKGRRQKKNWEKTVRLTALGGRGGHPSSSLTAFICENVDPFLSYIKLQNNPKYGNFIMEIL